MKRYLWILIAAPGLAIAQAPAGMATPTLGYVYDADAQSLRALEGVPGAALLGEALHLDTLFDAITVSSTRRYALGTRPGEGKQAIIRLDGRTGVARGSELPAGRSFFSPGGGTLAILTEDGVEIWTGLPDNPSKLRRVQGAPGEIRKIAVSDDGGAVAALVGEAIWNLGDTENSLGEGYRDMQFLRSSQDLVALSGSRLTVFRKVSTETKEDLLGMDTGGALAFALSRDENIVALLGDGSVTLVQRTSQGVATLGLNGTEVAGLVRAEGNAVFQLQGTEGIWLVDGDSAAPRLVAVETRDSQGVAQ